MPFIAIFLGGLNKIVGADKTVHSKKETIKYPKSTDDDVKDTVCILGAKYSVLKSLFFLKRVRNIKTETSKEVLDEK